jgi:hypothetical protein
MWHERCKTGTGTLKEPFSIMNPKFLSTLFSVAALGAFALIPPSAHADVIMFDLTVGNSGGLGCCTGPYALVTVNRTSSTTATIRFDSLTNGGFTYLLADGGSVGFNVSTAFTLGTITGTNSLPGFTPGPYSNGGPGNEDGFGSFNQTINSFDGFTNSSTEISVDITDTGAPWADASAVLANNASGNDAAIHGFACAEPGCNSSTGAFATGFASVSGPIITTTGGPLVPEPSTLAVLGSALAAMGFVRRRRKPV